MMPQLTSASIFMSMFFGLRGMANCPVESMKMGGYAWFVDLTSADPLYLLPILTSTSLFIHLYVGADGMSMDNFPPWLKMFFLAMPIISLPVMCAFPAALNVYWFTNNLISVSQARALKHKTLRQKLDIGEFIHWKPEDLPMNDFQKMFKDM